MTKTQKLRLWAFTINGVNGLPPNKPNLVIGDNKLLYYKYQLEKGEQCGTLHYQGCLRFADSMSMAQVKTILGDPTAHLEGVKQWEAMRKYCGKAETRQDGPWEEGNAGEQGKRKDLETLAEVVKRGVPIAEIAEEYAAEFIKYNRGILALRQTLQAPRKRLNLKCFLLYGDTGIGKSWTLNELFPDAYRLACARTPWANGYDGQRVVIIEEFGPGMMDINILKRLLDIYPVQAPTKGGMVAWNPDLIFITTNTEVPAWYPGRASVDILAVQRRLIRIDLVDLSKRPDLRIEDTWPLNRGIIIETLRRHGENVRTPEDEAIAAPTVAVREVVPEAQVDVCCLSDGEATVPGRRSPLRRHQARILHRTTSETTLLGSDSEV
jgi:hypothetical protein